MAVIETAAARALLPQRAPPCASSLPATHPNGCAHDGQPVPTYSTVLLAVWPHVVSVSVPPAGAAGSRYRAYTRRGPGKNVWKPAEHAPAVYMPPLPDAAVDARGVTPLSPARVMTVLSPPPTRQTGRVGDGVRVDDNERVGEAEWVGVADGVDDGERVPEAD